MQIEQIFESLTSPVNYVKTGYGWEFTVNRILYSVLTTSAIIQRYKCTTIGFVSGVTGNDAPLNTEPEHARAVLSTVVAIVKTHLLPCDLLFIVPDDINIDLAERKMRMYNAIGSRLRAKGVILGLNKITFPEFIYPVLYGIPYSSSATMEPELKIKSIAYEFGIRKLQSGMV